MDRRTFITSAALACTAGCIGTKSKSNHGTSDAHSSQGRETPTATSEPEDASSEPEDVSSEPAQRAIGGTFVRPDSVSITVESIRLAGAVRLADGTTVRASSGNAFLLAAVHTTNTGRSAANLPTRHLLTAVSDGGQYPPHIRFWRDNRTLVFPESGELYQVDGTAHPDDATSGWVVFEVPRTTSEVRLSLLEAESTDPAVYWEGTVDPNSLPDLEIQSIDAPAKHANGESVTFSVDVTNTGGSPGLFEESFTVGRSTAVQPQMGKFNGTVPPGETVTIEKTLSARSLQTMTIAVGSNLERTVRIVPARRTYGSSYELYDGVQVRVNEPLVTDSVTIDRGGSNSRHVSSEMDSFATVGITAWNPTNKEQTQPDKEWFEVESNGFIDSHSNRGFDDGLIKPIDKAFYSGSDQATIAPGTSLSGVLYFDVPKQAWADDVICRLRSPVSEYEDEVCEWVH